MFPPVEVRVNDNTFRHEGGAVAIVKGQIVALGADGVTAVFWRLSKAGISVDRTNRSQ